jgi:hypothetical protein
MSDVMQNPPLAAYYSAAVGYIAGWSEHALHLAFRLPALVVVTTATHGGLAEGRYCRQEIPASACFPQVVSVSVVLAPQSSSGSVAGLVSLLHCASFGGDGIV